MNIEIGKSPYYGHYQGAFEPQPPEIGEHFFAVAVYDGPEWYDFVSMLRRNNLDYAFCGYSDETGLNKYEVIKEKY